MVGDAYAAMKNDIGFDQADARHLAELKHLLADTLPEVVDIFYESMGKNPEARSAFAGYEARIPNLKKAFSVWLDELFGGNYDAAFFHRHSSIGRAHLRANLPQYFMFTAMNLIRLALVDRIRRLKTPDVPSKIAAIHKILDLELAVMNETYREDAIRRMQELQHEKYKQRLSESEHLANIGQLAASLAHEIKNPLAGISGAVQVLGSGLDEDHPHKEIITEALQQIDRLDAAVKDLLVYARPKPPAMTRVDLNNLLGRAMLLFQEEPAFKGVTIVCEGFDGENFVGVDEAQMQQVISNLMLNAAHACIGGGKIICRIEQQKSIVKISIRDNGIGMEPEVVARVHEPFFTTRARGTGLGLPICDKIIEAHNGTIDIQSESGVGTCVTIEIPRNQ